MKNVKAATRRDYEDRMDKVLEYIHEHLDGELSLEQVANVACFSPYHFHRIFGGMVGESLKSYIRRLRLQRAAVKLKQSSDAVTQIAFEAGFETHESFTRAFNKMFGLSPVDFRKTGKLGQVSHELNYWKDSISNMKCVEMPCDAMETFAGGIAHDFNNILTAIFGYTELLQLNGQDNPKFSGDLNEIIHAATRAKELVQQILAFSCLEKQEMQPVEVSLVVKETLTRLRSSIPDSIEIKSKITSRAVVRTSPSLIHQVVVNLCMNACHAMRTLGTGTLTVSLLEMENHAEDFQSSIPPSLLLEISDTGHGMDKETLGKIFEPYFSTNKDDTSSGMGLAVVHGIIKSLDGGISVVSTPTKGTTFRITLPLIDDNPKIISPKRSEESDQTGSERILIIDDEESITTICERFFGMQGYQTEIYNDPVLAWEYFKKNSDALSLVVTDMKMPSMTGVELSAKMMELRSDIPIILCSGFCENMDKEKALELGFRHYLHKPVSLSELMSIARTAIDESRET